MNENEADKVIKETIEYANKEIKKSKKKYLGRMFSAVLIAVIVIVVGVVVYNYEFPVKYNNNLVAVSIPEDNGIDININLDNYKGIKAVLVNTEGNNYDLYINATQTLFTKLFKDNDATDHLLRVGNGMIVDFQSGQLRGHIPNGNDSESIKHIYYIEKSSNEIFAMDDSQLINYNNKVLIWERD